MTTTWKELELEMAILRVQRAQRNVSEAVTDADEDLARMHLALAAGHLSKVTKLHPGLSTWTPPKLKKLAKVDGLEPPQHQDQKVYQSNAGRIGAARRIQYRGRDERRFVGDLRPGQETRQYGGHRRLEVRNLTGGKGTLVEVEGEPIRYRSPYLVHDAFGEFEETMLPGVAAHLVQSADCRFLFDHGGLPLARTTSGTLKLSDTPTTLRFTAKVDTRQRLAQDLVIAIERGDVSQMSVGFVVADDTWSDDYATREISRLEQLLDVSAVTYPASPTTSIALAVAGAAR